MIAREGVGLVVRSLGLIVLVRLIGTTEYGLYSAPVLIVSFLAAFAAFGVDLFLLRRAAGDDRWFETAYAWLLLSSAVLAVSSIAAAQLVKPHLSDQRFVPIFEVLVLTLPINVLWVPAKCRLERAMAFGKIAVLEVVGDIVLYAVSVPLALLHHGAWAAVAGYASWQTWLLVGSTLLAGRRPRFHWSVGWLKPMLGFGSAAAAATLLDRGREALIPLLVGHFEGASGIGVVNLGMRLVDSMGFARRATWRLSVVAVGWLSEDLRRLRRAIEESMVLQALAIGPLLAIFAVASPALVPRVFGPHWSELISVFPFLAAGQLAASVFTVHASALVAMDRPQVVAATNLLRIGVIAAAAMTLGERYGLTAASAGVTIGVLGFIPLDVALRRQVRISYVSAALLIGMFAPLLCWPYAHGLYRAFLALPLVLALTVPGSRRRVMAHAMTVLRALPLRRKPRRVGLHRRVPVSGRTLL